MSLIVVSQPVGTLRLERFMSVSEREEAERVRRANCCKRRLCIYCTRIILDDSGVCEWCKKAFDEGKQDSHPPCTPSTRCIICAECEGRIVERERERCAGVAEKYGENIGDYEFQASERGTADSIAQAILKAP